MKKWLISLIIIFIVGGITSATLAGHVYYNEAQSYTDYDKQQINEKALENVYINSQVPVQIFPTTSKPYAEFTQTFVDLLGNPPKYQLQVEESVNSTYITLNQVKESSLEFGVRENQVKLVIYLPEGIIEQLDIDSSNIRYYGNRGKQVINLKGIDVNKLHIQSVNADISLDGSYESVNISGANSHLEMNSTTPTRLYTEFVTGHELLGIYEQINLIYPRGKTIIDSLEPCEVTIRDAQGEMELKGKYKKIDSEGNEYDLNVSSDSICQLSTSGYRNKLHVNGAFETISVDEVETELEGQITIIPKIIKMLGESNSSTLSLELPSNLPGITVKYARLKGEYDIIEENQSLEGLNREGVYLNSDFGPMNEEIQEGQYIFRYGDGSVQIFINRDSNNSVELIDGAYTSTLEE